MTNSTQLRRIELLLSDGKWHTNRELNKIAFRFSARLHELKMKVGIIHETKPHKTKKGVVLYRIPRHVAQRA